MQGGRVGEMKHSFTRALTARKVDFMMIITGEGSKSGWWRAFLARSASRLVLPSASERARPSAARTRASA